MGRRSRIAAATIIVSNFRNLTVTVVTGLSQVVQRFCRNLLRAPSQFKSQAEKINHIRR